MSRICYYHTSGRINNELKPAALC